MSLQQEPGKLFVVATPIGNLGDITYRSVEVLKNVDLILAEDTRTSGVLLKHYDIATPTQSFHAHNEHKRLTEIITKMQGGLSIAQISDAGTPGISDPGFLLVREALHHDIAVEVLPGPTAFIPALIKSGFPTEKFLFEGFLPHKKGRQTRIAALKDETRTTVFYESPHRLIKTLEQFLECLGPRQLSISRELTKKFEETVTGSLDEVLTHFKSKATIKGEYVIVLQGSK
ncbi:MAG: 16S rRNA (cytidine(1402)-2'-O)-methyltransferase [Bacteroidota bacterium]